MKILILISFFIAFKTVAQSAEKKAVANFFKDKTKIENPFELRDPFKSPQSKTDAKEKNSKGYFQSEKGSYSNVNQVDLTQMSVDSVKVVGVLIGKERRAMIRVSNDVKEVIILKEGDQIGPDKAELKAVLPGGIILVEKMTNVYGQEEYLETVIPISK